MTGDSVQPALKILRTLFSRAVPDRVLFLLSGCSSSYVLIMMLKYFYTYNSYTLYFV